jgi:hypothetical protein
LTGQNPGLNSLPMNDNALEVGDIIQINRLGYQHVGVYVGQQGFFAPSVIHNAKGEGVVMSGLDEFSVGSQIFIRHKATGNFHERAAIVQRALSLLGTKYDLINFNCEHAAYYAQRGVAESPQIAGAAVAALIVGGFALFSAFSAKKS